MNTTRVLAFLLLLNVTSCNRLVISTEEVISEAERGDMGLAGKWVPVPRDDDAFPGSDNRNQSLVVVGPDESGVYQLNFGMSDLVEAVFTVERLTAETRHCLVDVKVTNPEDGRTAHVFVYCLAEDNRLTIWHISSEKLRQQLRQSDVNAVIEYSWPFTMLVSEHHGGLRTVLRENAKLLAERPQVFTSD